MGETIGIVIAMLVISSFVLCMVIFGLSLLGNYFLNYNQKEELKRIKQETYRKQREKADAEKIKNTHTVKTQYPPPQPAKETSFEVTNIKESILVTETVYAD